jgi:hypothetical protein
MKSPIVGLSALLVFAACGKDSTGSNGGNTGPYRCLGQPLPTTAAATITVSGTITHSVLTPAPDSGSKIRAFKTGTATALDSTTTPANGAYTITLTTGGIPLDGYIQVTQSGYLDTYGYPPAPLATSAQQSVLLLTSSEFNTLSGLAGATHTAGKSSIAVIVQNCDGTPVAGATVSSTPGGTVRYNSGGGPSSSATSTAGDGIAYILNVTAGDVQVSASAAGNTLRAHTVNARADALIITAVTPGPLP